ncbi:MAG TPA: ABC transporter permease [Anaeromyxobacteraceae bacterium]|nr:ABC transporter permease [Anaeromyxobacteraceae bacterium]
MTAPEDVPGGGRSPSIVSYLQLFESAGILVLLAVVVLVASVITTGFFTYANLTNIAINAAIVAVTGLGMTFAIAAGGMDLSVGSLQALTAIVASALLHVTGIPVALLGALLVGGACGLLNGLLITRLQMPPFVATFGMMSILRGVSLLVTNGQSVMITGTPSYALINNGRVFGLPVPLVIVLVLWALLQLVLRHTPFGRHVCAIGGNAKAAVVSGIKVERTTLLVFAIVGLTAAISGVMLSAQLLIVDGTLGAGFELQTIAIAVLGGTSLAGGSGSLTGTLLASLLLATLSSALNIFKVAAFYQYLYLGILLVAALYLDTLRRSLIASSLLRRE